MSELAGPVADSDNLRILQKLGRCGLLGTTAPRRSAALSDGSATLDSLSPMGRSVWLDDKRQMPYGFDVLAKTADEAIDELRRGDVDLISLDHDLALEHYGSLDADGAIPRDRYTFKTGYAVVLWMVDNGVWPKTIRVHTWNAIGRDDMVRALREGAPAGVMIEITPALEM